MRPGGIPWASQARRRHDQRSGLYPTSLSTHRYAASRARGRSGIPYDGRILNVSTGGCLIEGPIRARVGQIFAVGYPKQSSWEIFRCKIMWAAFKGEEFLFGNVFLVMDEKAKHQLLLNLIEAAGVDLP